MSIYLRLASPLQSWAGQRVSPIITDTHLVPTFSGLSGLLGAALGCPIGVRPRWFKDLGVRVRVDDRGEVTHVIQIATNRLTHRPGSKVFADPHALRIYNAANSGSGKTGNRFTKIKPSSNFQNALLERTVLGGAQFLVEFTAPGHEDEVMAALLDPVFSPYLGRKAYVPTFPFLLGRGQEGLLESLPSTSAGRRLEVHEVTPSSEGQYLAHSFVDVEGLPFDQWLGSVKGTLVLA